MNGRWIISVSVAFVAISTVFLPLANAQQSPHADFWKGKLEIRQFNFSYAVGVRNRSLAVRSVDVWRSDYDLYQDLSGVAREELTFINRNRSVEGPMDVKLFNYANGTGLVFDKGRPQAIEGPLVPPVAGQTLGESRILGFICEGREYKWKTNQQATVELRSWTPARSTLRIPVLQVQYFTDNTGALLALTVRIVSHIEASSPLPASLFEPPPGLRVMKVPTVY